jgi:ribosomal protein S10
MNAKITIVIKSFDTPELLQKLRCMQPELKLRCKQPKSITNQMSHTTHLHKHDLPHDSNHTIPYLKRYNIQNSVRLPNTRTQYTVLRSPHIDKKSREQFEMTSHKQRITIRTEMIRLYQDIHNLTSHNLYGIQFQLIVNYKTRLLAQNKQERC